MIAMRQVEDVRTALIACLLIYCIKTKRRSLDLAFGQDQSGLEVLGRCKAVVEDDLISAFRKLEIRKPIARACSSCHTDLL
jgi:hypothetical protein